MHLDVPMDNMKRSHTILFSVNNSFANWVMSNVFVNKVIGGGRLCHIMGGLDDPLCD